MIAHNSPQTWNLKLKFRENVFKPFSICLNRLETLSKGLSLSLYYGLSFGIKNNVGIKFKNPNEYI